jgi:hypothetical protein
MSGSENGELGDSAQNVKMLAQVRRLLEQAGLGCEHIDEAVRLARSQRIERIGMRQYLNEMVRPIARRPARECALLNGEGSLISPDDDCTLVDYLAQHYAPETLPAAVLASQDGQLREFVL